MWSGPLLDLWEKCGDTAYEARDVLEASRLRAIHARRVARARASRVLVQRRLRSLWAAFKERRSAKLAERARSRASRDASAWAEAHEALADVAGAPSTATLGDLLADLRSAADGGGRMIEAEGEAESLRAAAEAGAVGDGAVGDGAVSAVGADGADGDADGAPQGPPPPTPPADLANEVLWTRHALDWLDSAETKRKKMCVDRVARVAAGDWTYATAKVLKGAKRRRLLEAKLDRGWRILWELRTENAVVVWFVVPHDLIARRVRSIDAARERELLLAGPDLGGGRAAEGIPLDPLGNTPLRCYAVPRSSLAKLADGWRPPIALTEEEKAVVAADPGTATLLLGRSGTGKTLCTVSRMLRDGARDANRDAVRLFVARSPRLVAHVRRMLSTHGDADARAETLDEFTARLGRAALGDAAYDAAYDPRRRVSYPRFLRDLWPTARGAGARASSLDPLTAWTQIRSFLKGSAEAVLNGGGLDATDFAGAAAFNNRTRLAADDERADACRVCRRYDALLKDRRLWDDADRARTVAAAVRSRRRAPAATNLVYVDEVQDSTQAELILLLLGAADGDARNLWLAGDTAQAVTYGVRFRFAEVSVGINHWEDGRPGVSSNPSTSPKSNSFSMILKPLILASRVLDD